MTLRISTTDTRSDYDLVIACCGYESRSRSMVERRVFKSVRRVAIGYGELEVLAYQANRDHFERSGFEVYSVPNKEFPEFIKCLLSSLHEIDCPSILLDISCFTRIRLAQIVEALHVSGSYALDVYYSLAEFSPPPEREPHNEYLCPVTSFFSGWNGEAERTVGLVCGLGYEQLKALGIIEYIDPFETWLFFPKSTIGQYDVAVSEANSLVLREVDPSNIVRYPVMDGQILMRQLLALIGAIREDFRCILMPLGPKVFAFASLLVGAVFRDVSVWRASSGRFAEPRERFASSDYAEFRVTWRASEDASLGNR